MIFRLESTLFESSTKVGFEIGGVPVGGDARCVVIAEVGQAHDGSLGTCHAFVDAVADSGADGIKFQTHIAAAESTPAETFRVNFSKQDSTRSEYWQRMEFTEEQWAGLADHASERGLLFLSSPFSIPAVEVLDRLQVPAWKIASGEISNYPMLARICDTGRPVLLSTGMSPWSEIDSAVNFIKERGVPLLVFQATTQYPCPPEMTGLNVLNELSSRYGVPVGLSDHSGDLIAGLGAAAMGASLLEVHVTMHRSAFGPDVPASVTLEELTQLSDGVKKLGVMRANPVDKDVVAGNLSELRSMFFKSVVPAKDLEVGTRLTIDDITTKKPGTGIPASEYESLLGRKLVRDVKKDDFLTEADLASA
jgi:N,N'-diacetyllegionaminate synthase